MDIDRLPTPDLQRLAARWERQAARWQRIPRFCFLALFWLAGAGLGCGVILGAFRPQLAMRLIDHFGPGLIAGAFALVAVAMRLEYLQSHAQRARFLLNRRAG